jgi:hypothetical protein
MRPFSLRSHRKFLLTSPYNKETIEGIDTVLSLRYYSRMRFAADLLPLLSASTCARVISVFAPGRGELSLKLDDLGLKEKYSVLKSISYPTFENTFFMEYLAATNPGVSFLHIWPGLVQTQEMEKSKFPGFVKWLIKWVLFPLIKLFCVPVGETGERMLFHVMSEVYLALVVVDRRLSSSGDIEIVIGWNGDILRNHARLKRYRKKDGIEKVVQHTMEVFGAAAESGG